MAAVAAACVVTFLGGISSAQTDSAGTPVASQRDNPIFEYSARKMLGYVSEARVAIGHRQNETARIYIDNALHELRAIRNTRDYLESMGATFGRVLYGERGSYYIPIADDTYAVRTYARGPFWSRHKASAVRDVELVSVDIAINPERATAHLEAAKRHLHDGDHRRADTELEQLLAESIHETTSVRQPFTRLRDNIYLTRILIRQENYDGARYTLKHARKALDEYEKDAPVEHYAGITTLRQEINVLDNTIKQHDPNMLKKAGDKVEGWWEDLKRWTQK